MDTKDSDDTNTITSVQLVETRNALQQQQSISKSNQSDTLEKIQSISQADNEDNKKDVERKTSSSDQVGPISQLRRTLERIRFVLLVIGIILSMFMISLNSTVVAP